MYDFVLAIDPGPVQSGICLMSFATYYPVQTGKSDNEKVLGLYMGADVPSKVLVAIEETQNYGMPAGRDLRDTIRWSGRFQQHFVSHGFTVEYIPRTTVKHALCNNTRAKDGNIIQVLADRFAPGEPNRGKGTKANPGWFYGFKADIWQAYALGVVAIDIHKGMKI